MSDQDTDQEPILVGKLQEALSVEDLHRVKTALNGAGFVIDEHLAAGTITIRRPGPDDTIDDTDEYPHWTNDQIQEQIDDALKRFEKKLDQLIEEPVNDEEDNRVTPAQHQKLREAVDADKLEQEQDEETDEADANEENGDADDSNEERTNEPTDEAPDETTASVTARRVARLENKMDHGTAYTSHELAAIAFDIDEDEVGASERGTLSQLKDRTSFAIKSVPHPNGGTKKLYYRGRKPELLGDPDDDATDSDPDADMSTYTLSEFRELSTADRADIIYDVIADEQPVGGVELAQHVFGGDATSGTSMYQEVLNRINQWLSDRVESTDDGYVTVDEAESEGDAGKNRQGTRPGSVTTQA
ncbi:hypothetical protein [Halorarum salinum]|uniref:Uncharacterized protein n=1 Tax=Halorarum salinum TaxID=2743089 RepID=A0A7D5QB79_9EURY|nr:hypothetical protein [Halobaculum salinum]QLG62039.1 hypothetical protein HUG12_10000 [Halobaculum salinum]